MWACSVNWDDTRYTSDRLHNWQGRLPVRAEYRPILLNGPVGHLHLYFTPWCHLFKIIPYYLMFNYTYSICFTICSCSHSCGSVGLSCCCSSVCHLCRLTLPEIFLPQTVLKKTFWLLSKAINVIDFPSYSCSRFHCTFLKLFALILNYSGY